MELWLGWPVNWLINWLIFPVEAGCSRSGALEIDDNCFTFYDQRVKIIRITSASIGAWKCNFLHILEIMTDRLTDQQTNQGTGECS